MSAYPLTSLSPFALPALARKSMFCFACLYPKKIRYGQSGVVLGLVFCIIFHLSPACAMEYTRWDGWRNMVL